MQSDAIVCFDPLIFRLDICTGGIKHVLLHGLKDEMGTAGKADDNPDQDGIEALH
jgi:hypothetical protein